MNQCSPISGFTQVIDWPGGTALHLQVEQLSPRLAELGSRAEYAEPMRHEGQLDAQAAQKQNC
ncbi:hypothetical protein RKD29_007797 [Streptomyces tendae]|uniref:hypothetical protein n=1 Tax=Streptomyces tendae TaxID=1932 RepID=UPI003838A3F3